MLLVFIDWLGVVGAIPEDELGVNDDNFRANHKVVLHFRSVPDQQFSHGNPCELPTGTHGNCPWVPAGAHGKHHGKPSCPMVAHGKP